jgi:hypothetical protein
VRLRGIGRLERRRKWWDVEGGWERGRTNLPAMMITRESSWRAASDGEEETSFSTKALRSQETMSWGYFSGSQDYAIIQCFEHTQEPPL